MQNNPAWIFGTTNDFVNEIEEKFGPQLKTWKGQGEVQIPIDDLLRRWFKFEIPENQDPALELGSRDIVESKAIESNAGIDDDIKKKK